MTRSERQLEDIRGIVAVRGDALDRAHLERWARALGLIEPWERAQRGT